MFRSLVHGLTCSRQTERISCVEHIPAPALMLPGRPPSDVPDFPTAELHSVAPDDWWRPREGSAPQGRKIGALCYRWSREVRGLSHSERKPLKQVEEETSATDRLVGDVSLKDEVSRGPYGKAQRATQQRGLVYDLRRVWQEDALTACASLDLVSRLASRRKAVGKLEVCQLGQRLRQ